MAPTKSGEPLSPSTDFKKTSKKFLALLIKLSLSVLKMIKSIHDLRPINFNYSLKSIPISSSNKEFKIKMYEKVDKLITKMRWKAFHLRDENTEAKVSDYDGLFPTKKRAPEDKLLTNFENDLYELINNLKFRKYQNSFTRKLNKDLKEIRSTKKVFVFADKSHSLYKISPDKYKKLITENITSTYKKSENSLIEKINNEAKKIVLKNKKKSKFQNFLNNHGTLL